MTAPAPLIKKTISAKRREWLRALAVGDRVALCDGISWSDAKVTAIGGRTVCIQAVDYYSCGWFKRTNGYDKIGSKVSAYIGPFDDHQRAVEVDEAHRLIKDFPYGFDGISDDIVVEAAKILRAGKRAS